MMANLAASAFLLFGAWAGCGAYAQRTSPSAVTQAERVDAIRTAFGLGCAVQQRDTARASAWASAAIGQAVALRERSLNAAADFAGIFHTTETEARAEGGFKCEDVPNWPVPMVSTGKAP